MEGQMKSTKKKYCQWILVFILSLLYGMNLYPCDTWAALANATARGLNILAKNSDRLLFDCQPLMFYPRTQWPAGTEVNLGRISIPQVEETFATLGSSPYWCWGYEEGINEYGVAIGNEGVFSKQLIEQMAAAGKGAGPQLGPTGMDLLRLGLERGKTAREALDVICGLLEKYGQFGSGMPTMGADGSYDNSYIIADPKEIWILETAGNRWIAKKYTAGVFSISNRLSLAGEWDLASPDLVDFAVRKGWWPEDKIKEFNFQEAYAADTPQEKARNYRSRTRQNCSLGLLEEKRGEVTLDWMKRIARDRSTNPSIDLDQTASSCVAVLPSTEENLPVFWWCASTPSSSCYVPFFVHGSGLPEIVSAAGTFGKKVIAPEQALQDSFSENSYWWLFKDLRDLTNIDWAGRNPIVRGEFDALEAEFAEGLSDVINQAVELRRSGKADDAAKVLDDYTATCVNKAVAKANELRLRFEEAGVPELYRSYIGTYIANFGSYDNAEFEVKVQNNSLAVDIPGQGVAELKDADEEGLWYFKVSNRVAVSFAKKEEESPSSLRFHETAVFPRKKIENEEPKMGIPETFLPYVGTYTIPMSQAEFSVLVIDDRLALQTPDGEIIELAETDMEGHWIFVEDEKNSVSFVLNRNGEISAMSLHSIFTLPKKNERPDSHSSCMENVNGCADST
jgi:secernin